MIITAARIRQVIRTSTSTQSKLGQRVKDKKDNKQTQHARLRKLTYPKGRGEARSRESTRTYRPPSTTGIQPVRWPGKARPPAPEQKLAETSC